MSFNLEKDGDKIAVINSDKRQVQMTRNKQMPQGTCTSNKRIYSRIKSDQVNGQTECQQIKPSTTADFQ